jgi:hypothetical protein
MAEFVAWWINPKTGFAIPERAGVLRYYVRVAEKIVWADRPEDLIQYLPPQQDLPSGIDPPLSVSVTFIPASGFDNPALLQVNPEYLARLLSLPLLERERLLGGNWKIRPAAGLYFKREWCTIVEHAPTYLDVVCYWDLAATEKTELNDPDWTVGIKLGRDKNGGYWLLMRCPCGPTRATSKDCCSTPLHRMARRSRSGSGRMRGRPARARHSIWCVRSAASPSRRQPRAVTNARGSDRSAHSAEPAT